MSFIPAMPGMLATQLDAPLREALVGAERSVRLAAPYIGAQVAIWLAGAAKKSTARWRLLTHLDPISVAYGSLSIEGLRKLLQAGVEVRNLNDLHAKVYLTESAGFLTSGNLTSAGLGSSERSNRELGVVLSRAQRDAAEEVFDEWLAAGTVVTLQMLAQCERQAALVPTRIARKPVSTSREGKLADLSDLLLAEARTADVWVKAIYDDETRADEHDWMVAAMIANPDNKGRPKIAPGDLVVIWAKEAQSCYAVVRVTSESERNPQRAIAANVSDGDANRWPWVNDTEGVAQVPAAQGLPLIELGLTGQSLQGGYCRMPAGGYTKVMQWLNAGADLIVAPQQ